MRKSLNLQRNYHATTQIDSYSKSNDQDELFDKIIEGKLRFPSPYWDKISDSAKVNTVGLYNLSKAHQLKAICKTGTDCGNAGQGIG